MNMKNKGFTLVEMLVVVAAIAILAAIAMPSYSQYVRKAKRAEAKTALMSVLQAQEKFRANCIEYAASLGTADSCTAGASVLTGAAKTPAGLYDLKISLPTSATDYVQAFTATATAVAGTSQDQDTGCRALTLTMTQGNVATAPSNCW